VAAAQLSAEVRGFRERNGPGRTLLVGHSHGGSIAVETASLVEISAAVTLATPFVSMGQEQSEATKLDLGIGMITRFFAPVLFILVLAFAVTRPTSSFTATVFVVLLVLLVVSGLAYAFLSLLQQAQGEATALTSTKKRELIGRPLVLAVSSTEDWVLLQLRRLDTVTADAADFITSTCGGERATVLAGLAGPDRSLRGLFRFMSPWLREVGAVAIFGTALLLQLAALDGLGAYPTAVREFLVPWLYPTTNEMGAKFFVYAPLLILAYCAGTMLASGHWRPSVFESAVRLGRYFAMAARLSQVYSFKAGLFGLSGFCLHMVNAEMKTEYVLPSMSDCPVSDERASGHSTILLAREWVNTLKQVLEVNEQSLASP
jgi:pimeloyl-ACP methyl ester carboxylesterase